MTWLSKKQYLSTKSFMKTKQEVLRSVVFINKHLLIVARYSEISSATLIRHHKMLFIRKKFKALVNLDNNLNPGSIFFIGIRLYVDL